VQEMRSARGLPEWIKDLHMRLLWLKKYSFGMREDPGKCGVEGRPVGPGTPEIRPCRFLPKIKRD